MSTQPRIDGFPLGDFATNCYVVSVPPAPECWIVDCGYRPGALLDHVRLKGLKPVKLILTHAHCDHMAGVDAAMTKYGPLPLLCHSGEHAFCGSPELNLSAFHGAGVTCVAPTDSLNEGQELELNGSIWRVWHTPGHSPGSVCLIHDGSPGEESGQMLGGDLLFAGSIGRTDFPTSNPGHMKRSLSRLLTLPDSMKVYPGHGGATTIGQERRVNPFLRGLTPPQGAGTAAGGAA